MSSHAINPTQYYNAPTPDAGMDARMEDVSAAGDVDGSTPAGSSRDGEQRPQQRHKSRGHQRASSFLLQPAVPPTRSASSSRVLPRSAVPSSSSRRKREGDEPELLVPKRQSNHRQHQQRHSLASSPLATTCINASSPEAGLRGDGTSPAPGASRVTSSAAHPEVSSDAISSDSAQIVNLALNLSESRRRNVSGRAVSGASQRGRRLTSSARVPSTSPEEVYKFPSGGRNVRNYTSPDQRDSTFLSHVPGSFDYSLGGAAGPDSVDHERPPFEVSAATAARAEKAKNHFELFEEYLRLLPHLPPLPHAPSADAATSNYNQPEGRVYNPLQYIRNRKVRFREKCAIDTTSEGWEDTERVRNWIEAIVSSNTKVTRDPNQCVQLPPLRHDNSPEVSEPKSPDTPSHVDHHTAGDSSKLRRPRVDWITSPADLIADVAWLEKDANKLKIEDRDGDKIYDSSAKLKAVPLQELPSLLHPPSIVEDQATPGEGLLEPPGELPSFHSALSDGNRSSDRGRRRRKLKNSISLPSQSGSRDRTKHRWRKALSRSRSSSSDSTSDDDGGHRGRRHFPRLSRKADKELEASDNERQRPSLDIAKPEPAEFITSTDPDRAVDRFEDAKPSTAAYHAMLSSVDSHKYSSSVSSSHSDRRNGSASKVLYDEGDSRRASLSDPALATYGLAALSPPESRTTSPTRTPLSRLLDPFNPSSDKSKSHSDLHDEVYQTPTRIAPYHRFNQYGVPIYSFEPHKFGHSRGQSNTSFIESSPSDASPTKGPKGSESRLRGIFKGGRIAEIMGNEVSRVGDFIWKKEPSGLSHSRQSSSASSNQSEYLDADEEKVEEAGKPKIYVSEPGSHMEDSIGPLRSELGESEPYHFLNLPHFRSTFQSNQQDGYFRKRHMPSDAEADGLNASRGDLGVDAQSALLSPGILSRETSQDDEIYRIVTRDRPPVTGLSALEASSPATARRPTLTEATRNWSLSSHSITQVQNGSHTDRREIARVRAHLLSSGIKALEIRRQADTIRDPPPIILQRCIQPDNSIPRVAWSEEVTTVARSLKFTFENEVCAVRQSMNAFSSSTCPDLLRSLEQLEHLVTSSFSPRIRAVTAEAEALTSELATTNTLAIKHLNTALDKGLRKRKRRFRWVSRAGFVLLEWVVVGAMWWVWMVVMVWKVLRGLWRGSVSGVRWILWL
ncbi:hypothetical protein AJ80_01500 [Polytolypa hystricis UAMH7299]|uniref:Uncharacterized protein n=1 Tax=Polytolypa hystricis (strain UAMH7299) TaxID=1447883 RepID=A0A2B7YYH3_POLH7|nr:hypothetical protein AJ80_01500 [Polytolypa hystricis UAMH7299]